MANEIRFDLDQLRENFNVTLLDVILNTGMSGPQAVQRIVRPGLQAAARIVRAQAKKNIRNKTGNLRRGVRVRYKKYGKFSIAGGEAQLFVGPPGYHWHLVEYGHAIVTKSGQVVGQVRPHPFLEPALLHTEHRQLQAATRLMQRLLARELAKGFIRR